MRLLARPLTHTSVVQTIPFQKLFFSSFCLSANSYDDCYFLFQILLMQRNGLEPSKIGNPTRHFFNAPLATRFNQLLSNHLFQSWIHFQRNWHQLISNDVSCVNIFRVALIFNPSDRMFFRPFFDV